MGYVYMITNTVNGKAYIGISVHEPKTGRIKDHLSGNGNRVIANAVKKYGRDAFTYELLEENVFPEILPELEIYYIKKHNTIRPHGYNLTEGGEGSLGYKHTKETRKKLSEAAKGKSPSEETRRKISEAGKGRKHSIESRRKISEANTDRKFTESHRINLSDARKGKNNGLIGKDHPMYGKPAPNRSIPNSIETRKKISEALKGKPVSEETRRKISEAQKSNPSRGMLGKKHSDESRNKMSASRKGRKFTESHRRKISDALKGRPLPENLKNNLRHPDYMLARQFFHSLLPDTPLKEKIRFLKEEFPDRGLTTIYRWAKKWQSEPS